MKDCSIATASPDARRDRITKIDARFKLGQPASEFRVPTDAGERLVMDALKHRDQYKATADDPELSEYFVRVECLRTAPAAGAFNGLGLFGNQNTVCQPTTPKWRHTVERLKSVFNVD